LTPCGAAPDASFTTSTGSSTANAGPAATAAPAASGAGMEASVVLHGRLSLQATVTRPDCKDCGAKHRVRAPPARPASTPPPPRGTESWSRPLLGKAKGLSQDTLDAARSHCTASTRSRCFLACLSRGAARAASGALVDSAATGGAANSAKGPAGIGHPFRRHRPLAAGCRGVLCTRLKAFSYNTRTPNFVVDAAEDDNIHSWNDGAWSAASRRSTLKKIA